MAYLNKKVVELFDSAKTRPASEALLYKTKSMCTSCSKTVGAEVFETGGRVYMRKNPCCDRKGNVILRENDADFFKETSGLFLPHVDPMSLSLSKMKDLRTQLFKIFLTPKCNARCQVCLMDWQMGRDSIGLKRVEFTPRMFETLLVKGGLKGKEILISGGEPTVRDDLPEIVRVAKRHGNYTNVYSNGKRLANDKKFVRELKEAGLDCVQLSFESFNDWVYEETKGERLLSEKLKAIRNLKSAGITIVLSPTVASGYNEGELGAILDFSIKNRDAMPQLIFRPLAPIGRVAISPKRAITPSDILNLLEAQTGGKVRKEDFVAFMEMRKAIFDISLELFGEKAAYKFGWGRGYTNILHVDKRGNYSSYFSFSEMKEATRALKGSLVKGNPALTVARLAVALPGLVTRRKLSLFGSLLSSGFDKIRLVNRTWGKKDLFQLHIADPSYRMNIDYSVHTNVIDFVKYEGDSSKDGLSTFGARYAY